MWFSLNMHLDNPKETEAIDKLFGDDRWKKQPFMLTRQNREKSFLEYFCSLIKAQFHKEFRVRFSPEDKVKSGHSRTKYYLIHFSNHSKAVLLMKQVMWSLGDEEGTFDYSASPQGVLISRTPRVEELVEYLQKTYIGSGRKITFLQLQEETYQLPFIEKHYRQGIKQMEVDDKITVKRIESKKTGIKEGDIIIFP